MESSSSQQAATTPSMTTPQASVGKPLNPIQTTTNIYEPRSSDFNMLSPPITPVKCPAIDMPVPKIAFPPTPRASLEARPALNSDEWATTVPKIYSGRYSLGKQIGAGAWSTVAVAEQMPEAFVTLSTSSMTPPPSPAMTSRGIALAIKVPNQRTARPVLSREARVLTFLSANASAREHIVGFYGQDPVTGGIVMDFIPRTLSRFVADRFRTLQLSTSTMYDPVIGEADWKSLARRLIGAVAWLHSMGVAHGDIKADNILMRRRMLRVDADNTAMDLYTPTDTPTFEPLLCDFSSALILCDPSPPDLVSTDAITTTYASPDLLAGFSVQSRTFTAPIDRPKADVWAIAVCLVLAATGTEPYAEARLSIQKVAMARHGDVLGSVRGGGQATRIMKGGYVARTVAMGLAVKPGDRVSAADWNGRLAKVLNA